MGLASAICLGVAVTLLSGGGGGIIAFFTTEMIEGEHPQAKPFFFIATAIAVVGAVIGFFAGGGALAATAGAFALVGTATALTIGGVMMADCCKSKLL